MTNVVSRTRAADLPASVVLDRSGHHLTLRATEDHRHIGSDFIERVSVGVDIDLDSFGDDARFLGFAFTQFALPVRGSRTAPFDWGPASNLISPPMVVPLLIEHEAGVTLLAPLDSFHEQVIEVTQTEAGVTGMRWGWHGNLDDVPAGFATTAGVYEAATPREALARWRAELEPTEERVGHDDPLLTHLSYWTDNGAAYWYRREPGTDLPTSITDKIDELRDLDIGIGAVELDSWFYTHEVTREVNEVGYLDEVPPTGMLEWLPRSDVLPDGVDGLAERLGSPPLVLHSRHISKRSPYLDQGDWWTSICAQPRDPAFFRRWFADAASWGATCIEQDWMVMTWFGVDGLRAVPGRGRAWLEGLNDAAADNDMSVLFCMATPADFCAAASLDRVIAIRTCDDYRYANDRGFLWRWFLGVNRLADVVGLPVFKDCFFSGPAGDDPIDGDEHAEVESMLAALGGGVVGIGDRIGRTDVDIVRRVARPDGTLLTPERGLTIRDESLFDDADSAAVTWAEASDGDTRYIVALHLADEPGTVSGTLDLDGDYAIWDWRSRRCVEASSIEAELDHRDWALYVCRPIEERDGERVAVFGDVDIYATMSTERDRANDVVWSMAEGRAIVD